MKNFTWIYEPRQILHGRKEGSWMVTLCSILIVVVRLNSYINLHIYLFHKDNLNHHNCIIV